jgi:hypothetical protein
MMNKLLSFSVCALLAAPAFLSPAYGNPFTVATAATAACAKNKACLNTAGTVAACAKTTGCLHGVKEIIKKKIKPCKPKGKSSGTANSTPQMC